MKNVAIIGGGLAGLSCAFALKKRGIPSVVFEKNAQPGGRASAAVYLFGPAVYSNTFQLTDELGLGSELIEIRPIAGQLYKGTVYRHTVSSATGLLQFKGLNLADKALLARMAYLLVRYGAELDFHHPEVGAALDDESAAAFVKRELSQNILNVIAGPLISTLFFYGSEETSKLLYLNLAKHMHSTRMYTIRGGLGRLSESLADHAAVEHSSAVSEVGLDGAGYLVGGQRFSDLVVAIPGNAVLGIAGMSEMLTEADRNFFETCRYNRTVGVTFDTEQPVDSCYALSIPRIEKLSASTIIFQDFIDPGSVANGRGRVTIVGGGDSVTTSQLLDDFEKIYRVPPDPQRLSEWESAVPKFPPGRFQEIAAFAGRTRRPGLFFCGDYMMGPFVEAAITTALGTAALV